MSLPPPVNLLSPYVSAYKVGVATGVCTKGVFPFKEQNSVLLIKGDFVKKNGARSHGLVMRFCIPRKRRQLRFKQGGPKREESFVPFPVVHNCT